MECSIAEFIIKKYVENINKFGDRIFWKLSENLWILSKELFMQCLRALSQCHIYVGERKCLFVVNLYLRGVRWWRHNMVLANRWDKFIIQQQLLDAHEWMTRWTILVSSRQTVARHFHFEMPLRILTHTEPCSMLTYPAAGEYANESCVPMAKSRLQLINFSQYLFKQN